MKKILIVKTSSLGDIIHCYDVLRYIRTLYPDVQIDWVVEERNAELIANHPWVNRAILISTSKWRKSPFSKKTHLEIKEARKQLRQENYDVAFDLQGNIKSGLILSQVRSTHKVGFGFKTVPEWPNLFFTKFRFNPPKGQNIKEDYLSIVRSYFSEIPQKKSNEQVLLKISSEEQLKVNNILEQSTATTKVMVCPGSIWPNKQLPLDVLLNFLKLMKKEKPLQFFQFFFVWGSQKELEMARQLRESFTDSVLVDKMQLSSLQNLMIGCDLVIAMDSLPLHLAGTTNTPTYSVFGASSALKYKPEGKRHLALQGTCPYGVTFEKRCPRLRTCATGACIRALTAEEIYAHFKNRSL